MRLVRVVVEEVEVMEEVEVLVSLAEVTERLRVP